MNPDSRRGSVRASAPERASEAPPLQRMSDVGVRQLRRSVARVWQVWERKPLFCTAVPGESAWVGQLDPRRRCDAAAASPRSCAQPGVLPSDALADAVAALSTPARMPCRCGQSASFTNLTRASDSGSSPAQAAGGRSGAVRRRLTMRRTCL